MAGLSLLLLLPIIALIAIVIKLDSPDRSSLCRNVSGLKKRRFKMVKFRIDDLQRRRKA